MPNFSKKIVYLSKAQYTELITNNTITVDGVTITYNADDIYITPQGEPVTDVQVNGTSITSNGVANIPIVNGNNPGVITINPAYSGLRMNGTRLEVAYAASNQIKQGSNADSYRNAIYQGNQHEATFYGLAKVAGHDEASSTEPLGTYTPAAKGAIQSMLGVSDLIATSENTLVASKAYAVGDIFTANGKLYKATAAIAANDTIVLQNDGETISGANAIESKVSEGFPHDVQVNRVSVVSSGVANIPTATANVCGVIQVKTGDHGLQMASNGILQTYTALSADIKGGNQSYRAIAPNRQHESVFYGLAKIAGANSEKDNNTINNDLGTYSDVTKGAIQHLLGTDTTLAPYESDATADAAYAIGELFMLNGKLHQATAAIAINDALTVGTNCAVVNAAGVFTRDVQVDGTSIISNGVANIPVADSNNFGVVKAGGYGIYLYSNHLRPETPTLADSKAGTTSTKIITPQDQHKAVFYGLAKAAGDTTMSSSSNAVGTYTDSAKASIKQMLGIVDGSTGTVDVSGAAPSIPAVENTRYVCGEVTSLSFTPAANGICIVRFTSGSTATLLTVPNTVKFPEWFDSTSLETNTVYEICVTDGVYGAVMLWAQ